MSAEPRTSWTQGQYNAWVEAGEDKAERRGRLERVPDRYRKGVELHVKTVFSIRKFHARNKSGSKKASFKEE